MKIAMLGHKRIPSREGGVEVVVEELSTRMVQRGHEVTCYNRSGKHALDKNQNIKKYKEYKGVKLVNVLTFDRRGFAALTSSFFATIMILFSNTDVVHYHAEGPCAWMWIIKWFSKKKIVATIHGLNWKSPKWKGFASKYIKYAEKVAVKNANEIIVLNKNTQDYFLKEYQRETIIIPNGVSKPSIEEPQIIKEKYGLEKDSYILFLGRIEPIKGIDILINSYKEITTNKKLVIAGGVSEVDEYYSQLLQMTGNDKNIIFTGFIQGKELDELYSNAYIYCLPSLAEGMPLSLLEAMSYGNCCITSDISECKEVIEDEGITFQKSNIKDLSNKLQELCDNKDLVNHYKKNAQEFILNKYNWDKVVDETLKIYE